ncbi:MAG: hypothetical protein E6I74_14240 [Chloroflexi bacterium]|nr:MAG: hypothetical protein E6I74_14240 [Chloroflexota bacterium]
MRRMLPPSRRALAAFSVLGSAGLSLLLPTLGAGAGSYDWTQASPSQSPAPRYAAGTAYDSGRGMTVLFGGISGTSALNDTWEWDGARWIQRTPAVYPPAMGQFVMAYDAVRRVTVLFGAESNTNPGETWEWDGSNWAHLSPATSPPMRMDGAMVYDANRDRMVLFGGVVGSGLTASPVADTWEWNGTTWNQMTVTVSPQARSNHMMSFDAARARVVLFGGNTQPDGVGVLSDTWEWDGANWTQLTPALSPSARRNAAIDYDSTQGLTLLFGGADPTALLGDAWAWDGTNWAALSTASTPGCRFRGSLAFTSLRQNLLVGGWAGCPGTAEVLAADTWHLNQPDAVYQTSGIAITARKNVAFNGAIGAIADSDPLATAGDYSASITWGDGGTTNCPGPGCTLVADGSPGAFSIHAAHTWARQGTYTVTVSTADLGGYVAAPFTVRANVRAGDLSK